MKWENVKLGDTATFVNGFPFKPSDWSTCGKEIIRIQNLTKSSNDTNRFEGEINPRYLVRRGDLLISWSATLGVYEWDSEDAWLNQHIFKVVFDKKDIDKVFFKYLIHSKLKELSSQVHGATMKHITKDKFDSINVALPPLPVQKQIAEVLDRADALCQKDKQLLQKYDELAQSIFYGMFGDPEKNEKRWEMKTLGALVRNKSDLVDGPFGSSIDVKKDYVEHGEIPVVRTKNVGLLEFFEEDLKFMLREKYETVKRSQVLPGDIVITKVGTIGNICIFPSHLKEGVLSTTGSCRFRPDKKFINPVFLVYNLLYQRRYMKRIASEGVQAFLNMTHIKSIPVMYPPLSLQVKFEEIIQKLQDGEDILINSNLKVCNLFDTLMDRHYT